jgi:hypothetical protein
MTATGWTIAGGGSFLSLKTRVSDLNFVGFPTDDLTSFGFKIELTLEPAD